jgi:hypothetical protein
VTRLFLLTGLCLAGCTGAKPVAADTDQPPAPKVVELKKSLPGPKEGGLRVRNADEIQKAFAPEATIKGTGGRECGAWKERVILTRPAENGGFDLQIRARTEDLDEDCKWEGDSLISARVEGRVIGVVWPHVVTYREEPGGAGLLSVMRGTTGGITAEVAQVMRPSYVRTLVLGFAVPVSPDLGEITEDRTCQMAIEEAWHNTIKEMDEAGRIAPNIDRNVPRCDPLALETCKVSFAFPYELVLSETEGRPAPGPVGCIGRPE